MIDLLVLAAIYTATIAALTALGYWWGYGNGQSDGYSEGHSNGYDEGYNDGSDIGIQET